MRGKIGGEQVGLLDHEPGLQNEVAFGGVAVALRNW